MITNPDSIKNKYVTKSRKIFIYLMLNCGIPLLGYGKNGEYYFADTEELRECIKEIPLYLRLWGKIAPDKKA